MTNEQLAVAIQNGNEDLYGQLWEQVRRFIAWKAKKRHVLTRGQGGVTVEDLAQSGYFAMVQAVRYYKPLPNYSFLSLLNVTLKTAFSECGGYRTSKKNPLDDCVSLDAPIGEEDDGSTLEDCIEDPEDKYNDVEENIWTSQLHDELERCMMALTPLQKETIVKRYFEGRTLDSIATEYGVTTELIRRREKYALQKLRRRRGKLEEYAEINRRDIDDMTPWYLRRHGDNFRVPEEIAIDRERAANYLYYEEIRTRQSRVNWEKEMKHIY